MAVTIAFTGGRAATISAATGAICARRGPTGQRARPGLPDRRGHPRRVFQIVLALAGVPKLKRFIPRGVLVGFVNALAILIFTAQVPTWSACPGLSTTRRGRPGHHGVHTEADHGRPRAPDRDNPADRSRGRRHEQDASSVAALDATTTKYESCGKRVDIIGLKEASAQFHENLAGTVSVSH